jgi:hypothetical protein
VSWDHLQSSFRYFCFSVQPSFRCFLFLAVASWSNARLKERESYYKHETLRQLNEGLD